MKLDQLICSLKTPTPSFSFSWDSTKVLIIASGVIVQLIKIQHIFYVTNLILTFDSNQKKKEKKKIQPFGPSTHLNSSVMFETLNIMTQWILDRSIINKFLGCMSSLELGFKLYRYVLLLHILVRIKSINLNFWIKILFHPNSQHVSQKCYSILLEWDHSHFSISLLRNFDDLGLKSLELRRICETILLDNFLLLIEIVLGKVTVS